MVRVGRVRLPYRRYRKLVSLMVKESQQEETVKEREQRMGFGKKERERETDHEFLLVVEQSLSWS